MIEPKQPVPFHWGKFFLYTSPASLAMVLAGILLSRVAIGLYVVLATPILLLATLAVMAACLRPGSTSTQRNLALFLNALALGFYGFVSWGLFMLWRIGPLKH